MQARTYAYIMMMLVLVATMAWLASTYTTQWDARTQWDGSYHYGVDAPYNMSAEGGR